MTTKIAPGSIVRLQLTNGADVFATFSSTCRTANTSRTELPVETLNVFLFDPLTSKMKAGLATFETADIASIEMIDGLPVKSDYLIDCGKYFVDFPMAFHSRPTIEWQSAREDSNAAESTRFFSRVNKFLHRHTLLAEPINDSEIWRHNVNALGLDFMRQHYRSMKNVFLIDRKLPSIEVLEHLLRATTLNRTYDSDWAFTGSPG